MLVINQWARRNVRMPALLSDKYVPELTWFDTFFGRNIVINFQVHLFLTHHDMAIIGPRSQMEGLQYRL